MHEETVDVSKVAAEAPAADIIDNLDDEICSEEEYNEKQKVTGSAIPQVDGTIDEEVVFTFVSDFHREDIEYTLKEVIPVNVEMELMEEVVLEPSFF